MKNVFLTSILALIAVTPAMAATFPSDGLLKLTNGASTTYTKAALYKNLGIESGSVNAAAYYDILPGYYLPANTYEPQICPANMYCEGVANKTRSANVQGSPVSCPSGYPSADAGSYAEMFCYNTSCDQPSSGEVSRAGRNYADGISTCVPTACVAGWSPLADINIFKDQGLTGGTGYWSGNNFYSPDDYSWISGSPLTHDDGWLASDSRYGAVIGGVAWLNTHGLSELGIDLNTDVPPDMLPYGYETHKYDTYPVMDSTYNSTWNDQNMPCYCNLKYFVYDTGGGNRYTQTHSAYKYAGLQSSQTTCLQTCANMFFVDEAGITTWRNSLLSHAASTTMCNANDYTATYSCGEGSGSVPSASAAMDSLFTLADGTGCTKQGYTFAGWNYSQGTVAGGGQITWNIDDNIEFVATWTANKVTIKWQNVSDSGADANGVLSRTMDYGADIKTPKSPIELPGQKFIGWRIVKPSGN